jgi:hypothetical protein
MSVMVSNAVIPGDFMDEAQQRVPRHCAGGRRRS